MSRTTKYLLTTVLIIAAALWILSVYRSCQNAKIKKDDTEISTNNTNGTNSGIADDTNDESVDDLYVEDDEGEGTGESDETSSNTDGESGGSDEAEDEETDDSSSLITSDTEIIGNGGEYLVIAGAFIAKSNAKKLQKQLNRKGYDSELRIFIGSDYHSVIAGDFTTESEAQSLARKIGGEAYVHKRRYPKKRR